MTPSSVPGVLQTNPSSTARRGLPAHHAGLCRRHPEDPQRHVPEELLHLPALRGRSRPGQRGCSPASSPPATCPCPAAAHVRDAGRGGHHPASARRSRRDVDESPTTTSAGPTAPAVGVERVRVVGLRRGGYRRRDTGSSSGSGRVRGAGNGGTRSSRVTEGHRPEFAECRPDPGFAIGLLRWVLPFLLFVGLGAALGRALDEPAAASEAGRWPRGHRGPGLGPGGRRGPMRRDPHARPPSAPRCRHRAAAVAVPVAAGSLLPHRPPSAAASAVGRDGHHRPHPGPRPRGVLRSGGSSTPFTVALPANASCPADTAHHGYHVYSYLVPEGHRPVGGDASSSLPSTGLRAGDAGAPTTGRSTPPSTPARSSASPTTSSGGRWSGRAAVSWPCRRCWAEPTTGCGRPASPAPTPTAPLTRYWNTQVTFSRHRRRRRPGVRLAGGSGAAHRRFRPSPTADGLTSTGGRTGPGRRPAPTAGRLRPASTAPPATTGGTGLPERRGERSGRRVAPRPRLSAAHPRPRRCPGGRPLPWARGARPWSPGSCSCSGGTAGRGSARRRGGRCDDPDPDRPRARDAPGRAVPDRGPRRLAGTGLRPGGGAAAATDLRRDRPPRQAVTISRSATVVRFALVVVALAPSGWSCSWPT